MIVNEGGYSIYLRDNTTDYATYKSVFEKKHYKINLNNPKFIIDAGAYTGITTIYFKIKYPNANIIAIEPHPVLFEILTQNIKDTPDIYVLKKALWHKFETKHLKYRNTGDWGWKVDKEGDFKINTVTLDYILSSFKINKVDLLKMNIEGAERTVLNHSEGWIHRIKNLYVKTHDRIIPGCEKAAINTCKHMKMERVTQNGLLFREGL